MCGRVVCYSSLEEMGAALGATPDAIAQQVFHPSYNIPPSQPLPMVFQSGGDRHLTLARWGLLPHWAKDESLAFKTFNARAETVREKASFKNAFKSRRCLIPVNGYYEWQRQGKSKIPYYFSRQDGEVLAIAGLFELWKEELLTCTVITTEANEMAGEIHDRMPVVLPEVEWQTWLEASPDEAYGVLKPAPEGLLSKYQVDAAVNNAKTEGAELIAPL